MTSELRPFWNRLFSYDWKFGLFLILLVCVPRFFLVMHANVTGNYSRIGIVMLASALAPFLFLGKNTRKKIGICRPKKISQLIWAFLAGLAFSLALFVIGKFFYGSSFENWYVYIGKSYHIPPGMDQHHKFILFSIMTITGMTFSPVGEELFFRGIVHGAFTNSSGEKGASLVDSLAFAFTHLAHFGLVYTGVRWVLYPLPSFIWVTAMFLVSQLFFFYKQKTGSLLGAIICHAAFNLGMIFCVFYGC